jgi:alpha-L-fucosidase 2
MIGKDVPLTDSHRHHSHLLWLHPLRERIWDRAGDRDVMRRSMDHWVSMQQRWHGYSYAVASSMYSVMDAPEKALDSLTFFTDLGVVDNCRMTVNTMYREGKNFALESPLAGAQSMLDMAVQSHDGVIKVFPSVSTRWPDASVAGLRTQGAFRVDADRAAGTTRWIRIHSESGAPLTLDHGIRGEISVRDEHGRPLPWRELTPGRAAIQLPRHATALIATKGTEPGPPRDVPATGEWTRWGLPS